MQSTAIQQTEQGALSDLAVQINEEHHQAEAALNAGLQHALRAGQLLLEAKALCQHGDWSPWLEENFAGSGRTARAYMLVAQRWPQVEAKWQRAANLSFRDALRIVAAPKPQAPESSEDTADAIIARLPVDPDLLAAIPELSPDRMIAAVDPADDRYSYYVELQPSVDHVGYYHLLVYTDLDTDDSSVIYNGRPCRYNRQLLAHVLEHVHGIKPMEWYSQPATGEVPWPVEADKTSKPGRFRIRRTA